MSVWPGSTGNPPVVGAAGAAPYTGFRIGGAEYGAEPSYDLGALGRVAPGPVYLQDADRSNVDDGGRCNMPFNIVAKRRDGGFAPHVFKGHLVFAERETIPGQPLSKTEPSSRRGASQRSGGAFPVYQAPIVALTLSEVNAILWEDAMIAHTVRNSALVVEGSDNDSAYHHFAIEAKEPFAGFHYPSNVLRRFAFLGTADAVVGRDRTSQMSQSLLAATITAGGHSEVLDIWSSLCPAADLFLCLVLVAVPLKPTGVGQDGAFHMTSKKILGHVAAGEELDPNLPRGKRTFSQATGAHEVLAWQYVPLALYNASGPDEDQISGTATASGVKVDWVGHVIRVGTATFSERQLLRNGEQMRHQHNAAKAMVHPFNSTKASECMQKVAQTQTLVGSFHMLVRST